MTAPKAFLVNKRIRDARIAATDVWRGFVAVTHNGMVLLGCGLALGLSLLAIQPQWRQAAEGQLLGWLMSRQGSNQVSKAPPPATVQATAATHDVLADFEAIERVTAADPAHLPDDQARVADWLSRKYRVAKEPLSALVAEAYRVGQVVQIDPELILAVMAMESRFNPFAASPMGAHGLMQVITRVHTDKYEDFGGKLAAFDPVTNLRVGAMVLKETVRRAGSVEGGLRLYVGAVNTSGQIYIDRVLSEHERLQRVANGERVAFNAFQRQTVPAPDSTEDTARGTNTPGTELEAEARPDGLPAPEKAS